MRLTNQHLLFFFAIGLFYNTVQAQSIQWASSADYVYDSSDETLSGDGLIGPPDALPYGEINNNALKLSNESTFATVIVNYDTPQPVSNLVVIENYKPGKIVNVTLFTVDGNQYHVYQNYSNQIEQDSRCLLIKVPENDFLISKVELNIDTQIYPGWTQIDAVGITTEKNISRLKKDLETFGLKRFMEENAYTKAKVNMGPSVNTHYNETKPVISPDGKNLYFCRQYFPGNSGGEKDPGDIYVSRLIDGNWSDAQKLNEPFNNIYSNGINSISEDGNTMLLFNQFKAYDLVEEGVSLTYRSRQGWSIPSKVVIKDYYNLNEYGDFFLSSDGEALIMAIEREDSKGDQDLYVSLDHWGNAWSEPVNLGDVINSGGAEFAPYLSEDGNTLYFSSEGHDGYGGSDIFYSTRLDDSWLNWSEPVNMGSQINSPYYEAYYSSSKASGYAFFTSTKGSLGGSKDIFTIALPKVVKKNTMVTISGQVINKDTHQPIKGKIQLRSLQDGTLIESTESSAKSGLYSVTVPSDQDYLLISSAFGFSGIAKKVSVVPSEMDQEMEKNVSLSPLRIGQRLILNDLKFQQSKADLVQEAYGELNRLALLLSENPNLKIELGGHTDNQGDEKLNMKLAGDRVEKIKKYLVDNGIKDDRMTTKAYGSSQPIASNDLEETRQLNRRVEITITDK